MAADTVLAAVLLAFSLSPLTSRDSDTGTAGVVVSVLLIAPLPWRRRAPVEVFRSVMLACGAELLLVDEFIGANVARPRGALHAHGLRAATAGGDRVRESRWPGHVPFAAILRQPVLHRRVRHAGWS